MKNVYKIGLLLTVFFLKGCNPDKKVINYIDDGSKKNILFIVVDDLKPLLSNYGESQMITPNFDRLAKLGMTFTNAHAQYAVCSPSRASVLTGTNPDRTKVWDLQTNFRESAPELISMPEYLISQGYETTAVGKVFHRTASSAGHDGKSWSMPYQHPLNYDPSYGDAALQNYQNPETKKQLAILESKVRARGINDYQEIKRNVFNVLRPSTEMADVSDTAYQDGLFTQTALKQLDTLIKIGKPWFSAVGYQKPHLPFVAPKRYWDLYDRSKINLAEFQDFSEGTPKIAYHGFDELKSYSDIDSNSKIGHKLPEDKQRELIHGYMACVSYIDAQIGLLIDELEKRKILDDTVIVLWGDHGWHLGDHTEWCKFTNFEQATRVPFMFAGPGVKRNQTSHHPVNLVDLFPTVFELANVSPSIQVDGKSLVPLLDSDESTGIDVDYAYHQTARGKQMGYSIRTDRYRYTEWHDNNYRSYDTYKAYNITGREFYDYEKDPLETKNLIDNPDYSSVVSSLQNKLKSHLTISVDEKSLSSNNLLNNLESLSTKVFEFNEDIKVNEITYFSSKENENEYEFLFEISNTSNLKRFEKYVGYIRYYNDKVNDKNKQVKGFSLTMFGNDKQMYIKTNLNIPDTNISQFDVFFINNENKNVSKLFTIQDLKLKNEKTISLNNKLSKTEKLLSETFEFNEMIKAEEIVYLNSKENEFKFLFKTKQISHSEEFENFTGYIRYYNGEINDQNKKVHTFAPKLLEIDGYKYIFAMVNIDNVELSKLDIFFIEKETKEISNFYTIRDLKLIRNVR